MHNYEQIVHLIFNKHVTMLSVKGLRTFSNRKTGRETDVIRRNTGKDPLLFFFSPCITVFR